MTDEQIKKIRWLERVKKAENTALMYSNIFWKKKEAVSCIQRKYRFFPSVDRRNAVEAKIADMLVAERRMNEKFEEAECISEEVNAAIQAIPDTQLSLLLNAKYMLFCTHEQTAELLGVSIRTEKRLHKIALDILKIC